MNTTTLGKIAPNITSGSRGWASYYSDKGALFLRMTNLPKEGIGLLFHDKKYVKLPSGSSEGIRTRVKQNDILISITAELGKIGFVENEIEEAYVNQHVALVRVESPDVHPKFLAFYLASQPQRNLLNRLNDSGAKSGLSLKTINRFPLSLPPLEEQKAIADVLSTWDRAISTTERLIQAQKKRFKWLLNKLINQNNSDWRKVKLGELYGKEITIEKGSPLIKAKIAKGKIPVVAGGQTYAYFHNTPTHTEECITISASGAYAGFVWFHDYPLWASDCNVVSVGDGNTKFYYYLLKSLQHRIYALQSGGAQPHVYSKDLKNLKVALPPLDEQKAIAETLNTAQREIVLLKKLADKYKTQKRGLMQKLLTGEWRVFSLNNDHCSVINERSVQ
ncbi:restriction endonuclease subunit S [Pontiellaceae bacterium B12219]|nr:restriction endonuclease subunit S [Pontiellaceae bacterium B12219]